MLGNLEYKPDSTSTPRTRYYYNGDNLLRQVDDVTGGGTTSTTITWDADSQRVKLARGSDTWEMICDPTASIPAVLLAKNYVSSATTYMFYVREPGGGLLASFDAAETQNKYYYHFDDLGSAVLVTNGSGTASDSSTYGAWGAVLASQSNLRPYQYVGRLGYYRHRTAQGTALANLLQLGVRFYDPEIGRFTQRDPVQTLGWSDYTYASDDPVLFADPSGRLALPFPFNSRVCNRSKDQCLIAYADGNYRVLHPGQCTSWFFDEGDFAYWNGDWFKCSGVHTCYIDDRPPDKYKDCPNYLPPQKPGDPVPRTAPSKKVCEEYCECQKHSKYYNQFKDKQDCVKKCRRDHKDGRL